MVGLGPDDDVEEGGAGQHRLALGLGDAAGHAQKHVATGMAPLVAEPPEPAELGIDFLGSLLANMAGVEENEVGVFNRVDATIAMNRQLLRHAVGVVDVHLAAESLDADGPGHALERLAQGMTKR